MVGFKKLDYKKEGWDKRMEKVSIKHKFFKVIPKPLATYIKHILWKQEYKKSNLMKLDIQKSGVENGIPFVVLNNLFFFGHRNTEKDTFFGKLSQGDFDKRATGIALRANLFILEFSDYIKQYVPKPGDVIVDAGANIGVTVVLFAKAVGPTGKVIAIEPEEQNILLMKKNIDKHKLDNVVIVPKGLYKQKEKKKLYLALDSGEHGLYKNNRVRSHGSIKIETDALDNILDELGIDKVDFVKMDIEGAEIDAIRGMETVLSKGTDLVIAAYHPDYNNNNLPTSVKLESILKNKKYNVKVSAENGFLYGVKGK